MGSMDTWLELVSLFPHNREKQTTRNTNLTITACLIGLVALLAGSVGHAQIWEEDFTHPSVADLEDLGYTYSSANPIPEQRMETDGSVGRPGPFMTDGQLGLYDMDVPDVPKATTRCY